jgi:hypothetical protein
MKSRYSTRSAPFTPEDHDVVAALVLHRHGVCWLAQLLTESYEADRRAADMMLRRENFLSEADAVGARRMKPALYWSLYPWR